MPGPVTAPPLAGDPITVTGSEVTAEAAAGKGLASYVSNAGGGVADLGVLAMAWFFAELARA